MTREERELSIKYLESMKDNYIEGNGYERHPLPEYYAIENAIKVLEKEPILDKISAEIDEEADYAYADFDRYKEDILHAESDELPDDDFRYGLRRAIEIIDKYKEESEENGRENGL